MERQDTSTQREYTYFAFISYKREDEKWARWLRSNLQRYRIPISTRKKEQGLPKRCSPIFLDKVNLRPGNLDEGLKSEVQDSRFLIMICSRHAGAESTYLDEELQFFLDSGGDLSRVIPFIVDQSDDVVNECFPKLLSKICQEQTNIVGVSIFDDGKRTALIKTVAAMLGIKREILESDDHRRRVSRTALASVLCAVLAVCGIWCWQYFRVTETYYYDYTEKYGIPVGIGKMSRDEARARENHYVIAKSRGKVRELRLENSSGKLIDSEDPAHFIHAAKMTYEYRGDDLDKVVLEDKNGRKSLVLNYKNNNTVDLDGEYSEEQNGQALILPSAGASRSTAAGNETDETTSKSNVIRYYFVYDDDGYTRELRYASDSWNNVGFDADGISGIRFSHDDLGRVDRTGYLTYTGQQEGSIEDDGAYQVMGNRDGIAGRSYSYQDYNLQDICCIDIDGKPIIRPDGYAGMKAEFDEHGNATELWMYDEEGRLTLADTSYAGVNIEHDSHGNQIKHSYYGTSKEPVLCSMGFSSAELNYDPDGNIIKCSFFGLDGEPILGTDGYAGWEAEYDKAGNRIKSSYYGTDGEPILNSGGYAAWEAEYDKWGNMTRCSYFGADGKPVLAAGECASWEAQYDERGNQVSCCFFGTDGKSVLQSGGYASWKADFDKRGNEIRISYYGTNGNLVLNALGFAIIEAEYDSGGNMTRKSFYGIDGELLDEVIFDEDGESA